MARLVLGLAIWAYRSVRCGDGPGSVVGVANPTVRKCDAELGTIHAARSEEPFRHHRAPSPHAAAVSREGKGGRAAARKAAPSLSQP